MEAKTNANIINAVASGMQVPCPNCNTMNEVDSRFCMTCGTPLTQPMQTIVTEEKAEPLIPVTEVTQEEIPFASLDSEKVAEVPFEAVGVNKKTELPFLPTNNAEPEVIAKPEIQTENNIVTPFTPVTKKRRGAAFASISEPLVQEPEADIPLQPIQNEITTQEVMEAVSAFAEGLPKWDIVPPQVAVRRKKK